MVFTFKHSFETFILLFGHELGISIVKLLLVVIDKEYCQNHHFHAVKAIDKSF